MGRTHKFTRDLLLARFCSLGRGLCVKITLGFINRDFAPGAGRQVADLEGTELNAAQPDDFMAQRLEEPPDLPVFSLRQRHIEMRFPS